MAKRKGTIPRWAVDSSVIISIIKGNETIHGKPASKYSRDLFDQAEKGDAVLVVSGIALVEVAKPHPKAAPFSPPTDPVTIEQFFSNRFIEIIEVGRKCGELAREIATQEGLPPWDAVHVASAILGDADCFYCWDRDDILKHESIRGLTVEEPPCPPLRYGQSRLAGSPTAGDG